MAKSPSTTEVTQIKDIRDGVIFLKDGTIRGIVDVSAINFELRSTDEQQAVLEQFQGFLNSLDFPVQMLVQSRRFDISSYVAKVDEAVAKQENELLKIQGQEYARFVAEIAELANIMAKRFFVVIPITVLASPEAKKEEQKASSGRGPLGGILGMFKKKSATQVAQQAAGPSPEQTAAYRAQLQQRADLVISGLAGMGLKGSLMDQEKLIPLFTDLYNPVVPQRTAK